MKGERDLAWPLCIMGVIQLQEGVKCYSSCSVDDCSGKDEAQGSAHTLWLLLNVYRQKIMYAKCRFEVTRA